METISFDSILFNYTYWLMVAFLKKPIFKLWRKIMPFLLKSLRILKHYVTFSKFKCSIIPFVSLIQQKISCSHVKQSWKEITEDYDYSIKEILYVYVALLRISYLYHYNQLIIFSWWKTRCRTQFISLTNCWYWFYIRP